MRHSNLHTHTVFSDGYYTVEETVLAAIDRNMISLGIYPDGTNRGYIVNK